MIPLPLVPEHDSAFVPLFTSPCHGMVAVSGSTLIGTLACQWTVDLLKYHAIGQIMAIRPLARHNPQPLVRDGLGDNTEDGR